MKKPIPERILNSPELYFGMDLYYDAFWDVATCRPIGLGAGYIPYSEIWDYAAKHGYDDEQRDILLYCVRQMDNAYLDFYKKKE